MALPLKTDIWWIVCKPARVVEPHVWARCFRTDNGMAMEWKLQENWHDRQYRPKAVNQEDKPQTHNGKLCDGLTHLWVQSTQSSRMICNWYV